MSEGQLEILRHALGLDKLAQGEMYRNHFCAGLDDEPDCRQLVRAGFMQEHERTDWLPYYNCSVTEAGKKAMFELSPKPPKPSRSQKRYRDFLDADSGISFGEWVRQRV